LTLRPGDQVAVVGGGVLGLTLALRLAGRGFRVELFEAAPRLGGLACGHDYGPFTWDRFYHCILPQDQHLIGLLDELDLGAELRWSKTGTGYFGRGRFYSMSGNRDFLLFPLLSLLDKARLAALTIYATRLADPYQLYDVTAEAWLSKICGRRAYRVFWRPLLKAKFGSYHDQIAAVFIWATLTRLFSARGAGNKEMLGYCAGGYTRILARLREVLEARGAAIHLKAPVRSIRALEGETPGGETGPPRCELTVADDAPRTFHQVFFTGPTRLAQQVVDDGLRPYADGVAADNPTSEAYLGVACAVLALRRPLTPYYVLNIGDEAVELTGVIEMTNLVDRHSQTAGRALVYLPQYMSSEDPRLQLPDEELLEPMLERGLRRVFPDFSRDDAEYLAIHRARYVQPLPLARSGPARPRPLSRLNTPFTIINTSMLTCATLNNNEVVKLVDEYVRAAV